MNGSPQNRPALLVTIDTEPDDEWSGTPDVTLENIRRIPRLQELLDRHGVRPTYFVSYQVAANPDAAAVLRRIHDDGRCEIGAHLHAWRTPPHHELPGSAPGSHPYLYQFPPDVQRAKFGTLHRALVDVFAAPPTSHRAGKYGLDGRGVRLLAEFGYTVDSSVTPMTSWADDVQLGVAGPDFRRAPIGAYELSEHDPARPGRAGVTEVPVSVGLTRRLPRLLERRIAAAGRFNLPVRLIGRALGVRKRWFRPFLHVPLQEIEDAASWLVARGVGFLNMMFHSSELIPNSKWCRTEAQVDEFVDRIERLVGCALRLGCAPGLTISEFASGRPPGGEGRRP
ncbi:MAG: hypothetical protein ACOC70_01125 [bacterium]